MRYEIFNYESNLINVYLNAYKARWYNYDENKYQLYYFSVKVLKKELMLFLINIFSNFNVRREGSENNFTIGTIFLTN